MVSTGPCPYCWLTLLIPLGNLIPSASAAFHALLTKGRNAHAAYFTLHTCVAGDPEPDDAPDASSDDEEAVTAADEYKVGYSVDGQGQ